MTTALAQAPGQNITGDGNVIYHATRLDLEAALKTLPPETRRAYARGWKQFGDYCKAQGWAGPTIGLLRRSTLAAWESDMRQRGLSASTIRQSLAAVRWAAALAADAEQLDEAELARMRRVKAHGAGVRQGRWYDADNLQRLVRAPKGPRVRSARDRAVLALLAGCALRRTELCDLRLQHLDEREGEPAALVNLTGKGAKVRSVAIPLWARPYVAHWLRTYRQLVEIGPDSPLVCEVAGGGHGTPTGRPVRPGTVYRILRQATAAAGLPDIAPHDLRRTSAKLMHEGGADIVGIRDALGHASTGTTERYLETAQGPAMATLAMDKVMG